MLLFACFRWWLQMVVSPSLRHGLYRVCLMIVVLNPWVTYHQQSRLKWICCSSNAKLDLSSRQCKNNLCLHIFFWYIYRTGNSKIKGRYVLVIFAAFFTSRSSELYLTLRMDMTSLCILFFCWVETHALFSFHRNICAWVIKRQPNSWPCKYVKTFNVVTFIFIVEYSLQYGVLYQSFAGRHSNPLQIRVSR